MGNSQIPQSTAADVDAAAVAAQAAFTSFGASDGATRAALLRGLAQAAALSGRAAQAPGEWL